LQIVPLGNRASVLEISVILDRVKVRDRSRERITDQPHVLSWLPKLAKLSQWHIDLCEKFPGILSHVAFEASDVFARRFDRVFFVAPAHEQRVVNGRVRFPPVRVSAIAGSTVSMKFDHHAHL
jgi:hypothetical protein